MIVEPLVPSTFFDANAWVRPLSVSPVANVPLVMVGAPDDPVVAS